MRVFVLLVVRSSPGALFPPSVWHLQHKARQHHPRSLRASSRAYLWARDTLFQSLRRVNPPCRGVVRTDGLSSSSSSSSSSSLVFFTAMMDVAGCEEDVEVLSMLLSDLCQAWLGAAAHLEVCRAAPPVSLRPGRLADEPGKYLEQEKEERVRSGDNARPSPSMSVDTVLAAVEREETLLLLLSDAIEADDCTQRSFLERWGVDTAWDYAKALHGRSWWGEAGFVAILPPSVTAVVDYFLACEVCDVWSPLGHRRLEIAAGVDVEATLLSALELAVVEKSLTAQLQTFYTNTVVPQHLYEGAFHRSVVAVPPAVALFLSKMPSEVLQACLLFHTHDRPLTPFRAAMSAPTASPRDRSKAPFGCRDEEVPLVLPVACADLFPSSPASASTQAYDARYDVADAESSRIGELFHHYDILLSNHGAVRLPLPAVSRYVFALLVCQCDLPAALMAPFVRRHATAVVAGIIDHDDADGGGAAAVLLTEEEIVLGMKVTWAVQRWTDALRATRRAAEVGNQEAPVVYARWSTAPSLFSGGVVEWVEERMRRAQRKAQRLHPAGEAEAAALVVGNNMKDRNGRPCRPPPLEALERRLFSPLPLAYRGSSTAWLARAVQEVGEHYARVPAALTGEHSAAAAPAPFPDAALGTSSDSSDDDHEEQREEDGESGARAGWEAADAKALTEQMCELEALLERERQPGASGSVPHRPHASRTGARSEEKKESSDGEDTWLSDRDMESVSRNELFLRHVQLFGRELERDV